MTDILVSEIPPAALETVERAAVYFQSILYDLYGGRVYREVANGDLTPVITSQQGRADDGTERLIFRPSLQLNPEWRTSENPIWLDTLPFGDAIVPARYLV